jgi:PASTA domain
VGGLSTTKEVGVPVPAECQSIQDEIDALQQERESLQEELQEAPPSQKPGLIAQIRALNAQIRAAGDRLADCIGDSGPPPPPPPPLEARFDGTATITTTFGQAPGPYTQPVRFNVLLNGARTAIAIASFPTIQATFDTPFGRNTTTVTRTSGGSGSYAAGNIVMPLGLHFDQSIDIIFVEEDSDLNVVLTTNPPGSPVSPEPFGSVTLVGSGTFNGGILGGSTGNLTISGTISPFVPPPPTTVPDVREERKSNAIAEVLAAHLIPHTTGTDGPGAWVFSQSPAAGTVVGQGSIVTLVLRTGPIP